MDILNNSLSVYQTKPCLQVGSLKNEETEIVFREGIDTGVQNYRGVDGPDNLQASLGRYAQTIPHTTMASRWHLHRE